MDRTSSCAVSFLAESNFLIVSLLTIRYLPKQPLTHIGDSIMYTFEPLVQGFPGASQSHGGLGWSSVSLLYNKERRVLVETGPPAYIPLLHERLGQIGFTVDQITHVLITHLHWDHVGNFTMFPNAQVLISEREMGWASKQPAGTSFIPDLHVQKLFEGWNNVHLLQGGQEVLPGIFTINTPGHTPGHIAFQAKTVTGNIIFAGDSVKNRHELGTENPASTMDLTASVASIKRLKSALESDKKAIMVPGHDVRLSLVDGVVRPLEDQNVDLSVFTTAYDNPVSKKIF